MNDAERLVGTYRLLTFENFADDGEVQTPFGTDPRGFAMYTSAGYMSAILMVRDRPNFPEGDILAATDADRVAAFATSSAYAGAWEIANGQIVHHLEATTYPNWTDTDQYRDFDLTDTHFTLYPPRMLMQGKMRRGKVHFERIGG